MISPWLMNGLIRKVNSARSSSGINTVMGYESARTTSGNFGA